jgi:outer membrane protein TolC
MCFKFPVKLFFIHLPLRRNFRIDQNRGQIRIANLDLKINDSQFKKMIVDKIAEIQNQYWDLVGTIGNYDIARESYKLAQINLRNNTRKAELGSLPLINITESQANLAQKKGDLIIAEQKIYEAENRLLSLISKDRKSEIWTKTIVPTETPDFQDYKVNLETAIDKAIRQSPELEQIGLNMEIKEVNQKVAESARKWKIDLVTSFGTVGTAGPQSYYIDTLGQRVALADPMYVGGIGNSNKMLFSGGVFNWSAKVQLGIPLSNKNDDAKIATISIEKR